MIIENLATFAAVLFLLPVPNGTYGHSESSNACSITITSPKGDDRNVGPTVVVNGRATIPVGTYLFGFARRKGLSASVAWPQGGGAASIDSAGAFAILTTLGRPAEVGEFEILVQAVSREDRDRLDAWFRTTEAIGEYPSIVLPPPISGCGAAPRVTVLKVSS